MERSRRSPSALALKCCKCDIKHMCAPSSVKDAQFGPCANEVTLAEADQCRGREKVARGQNGGRQAGRDQEVDWAWEGA